MSARLSSRMPAHPAGKEGSSFSRPGVRKSGYEEPTREEPAAIRAIIERTGRQVKKVFPMGRNTNSYERDDNGTTEGVLVPSQRNSKYAPGRTFRTSFGRKHAMHSPPG